MQEARDVLDRASHIAETVYDTSIETVVLQARSAGVAIVEYAVEKGSDLILLGAHRDRPRSREDVIFGATADYVARNAPCAVWTVRAEVKPPAGDDRPSGRGRE